MPESKHLVSSVHGFFKKNKKNIDAKRSIELLDVDYSAAFETTAVMNFLRRHTKYMAKLLLQEKHFRLHRCIQIIRIAMGLQVPQGVLHDP